MTHSRDAVTFFSWFSPPGPHPADAEMQQTHTLSDTLLPVPFTRPYLAEIGAKKRRSDLPSERTRLDLLPTNVLEQIVSFLDGEGLNTTGSTCHSLLSILTD